MIGPGSSDSPAGRPTCAERRRARRSARTPRGATAVMVAICLVMLCGFLALALNVGHLLSVRGELQNAADAGALAGALELNGRLARLSAAEATAGTYASRHFTDSATGVVAESIELGQWATPAQASVCDQRGDASPDGHRFCFIDKATAGAALLINAVRVVTARTGPSGSPGGGGVELFASGIIAPNATDGRSTVRAAAVAVTGGPCNQDCPKMPIVLRAGCVRQAGGLRCDNPPVYYAGLNPAPQDSAGLTGLETGPAPTGLQSTNSGAVCDVVNGACREVTTPAWLTTSNGSNLVSTCADACSYHNGSSSWTSVSNGKICEVIRSRLDSDCDGNIDASLKLPSGELDLTKVKAQVPVVIYEGETEDSCPADGQYNQAAKVVGFATVALVSARCDTSSPTSDVSALCDTQAGYSADLCLAFKLMCNEQDDEDTTVGCGWFGTSPLEPVLVR